MQSSPRVVIHHCTSEPYRFFGRSAELALLDQALRTPSASVLALVGPGGQGKTAILQHWLELLLHRKEPSAGIFLWSFYRGKEVEAFLRELYSTIAETSPSAPVSASYCVDQLLRLLRAQKWVLLLDGTEVVQHEREDWLGRFVHPELTRLLQELASAPSPGVTLLTSRFPLPDLERRPNYQEVSLTGLDESSAQALLRTLGVTGTEAELTELGRLGGWHAKAVELLGTFLAHFQAGQAANLHALAELPSLPGLSADEQCVLRVLRSFQAKLPSDAQDLLALSTAFHEPQPEANLFAYVQSPPVHTLLHRNWARTYSPFAERSPTDLQALFDLLVKLRLLERVGRGPAQEPVLDAHPLVRRAFEHVLGPTGQQERASVRAGFLRSRPDRPKARSLSEAREETELFHAYCEAHLWEEADRVLTSLEQPRYRFLAPAYEKALLLRFFPAHDPSLPPTWAGFRRWRSLAICHEMLGEYSAALTAYRAEDTPLRGDALLALGLLAPLLQTTTVSPRWQMLWQAYRVHALCLAGQVAEAVSLAGRLVPSDVYEWTHIFEGLFRAGELSTLDMQSFLYRPPFENSTPWTELAKRRLRADYCRLREPDEDQVSELQDLVDAYDRGGLSYERCLSRLSLVRALMQQKQVSEALPCVDEVLRIAQRHQLRVMEVDALEARASLLPSGADQAEAVAKSQALRAELGYLGPSRP